MKAGDHPPAQDGTAPSPVISDLLGCSIACGAVLALNGVLLARDPSMFWKDDYAISILPVFADVARAWSEGHLPLLSPYSWICSNLAGEYQYGTFSVFVNAAVAAIWKLPLSFPQQAAALSITHLVPLTAGGYFLARNRNLPPQLAAMVGLVAGANGWIMAWGATDWFGALAALAWLPFSWWGMERALDPARSPWRFLWPVPFAYLVVTGGFPYTVLMLMVLAGWCALRTILETGAIARLWPLAAGLALAAGISSPAWLALLDYIHGSAREIQAAAAHFQWVVPPAALPGFILPDWTVNWADFSSRLRPHTGLEMACGLVAPVALLFGLTTRGREMIRALRWDIALLLIVTGLAMMPTAGMFRWSFRWLPLLHIVLALCGARALQLMAVRGSNAGIFNAGAAGVLAVAAVGGVMHLVGAGGRLPFTMAMLGLAALWFGAGRLPARYQPVCAWAPLAITFGALLATYWLLGTNVGVPRYHFGERLRQAAPLDPERLYLSVYPPPEYAYRAEVQPDPVGATVRPGSTSMWGGVRLINGYSPIRPAGVARVLDVGIHGHLPEENREYFLQWEAGRGGLLEQWGVDGIVVAVEIDLAPQPAEEWDLVHTDNEGRVYHRRGGRLSRVRSLGHDESGAGFAPAEILHVEETRHRVVADVAVPAGGQPALLAFSRPYFSGYRASLDGRRLVVRNHLSVMPAVEVPAGTRGRVVLSFRPTWLTAGAGIAAACAAVCAVALGAALTRRR